MKRKTKKSLLPLLAALLLLMVYLAMGEFVPSVGAPSASAPVSGAPPTNIEQAATPASGAELMAAVFDVGQGDCILVASGGQFMLIDAGSPGQEELIKGYLESYGVSSLAYVVATHPHADHIGSMSGVIEAMDEVGAVLMPEAVTTTKTFERLLDTIEQRGLTITVPQQGDSFKLGAAEILVVAPAPGDYDNLNNASLVLRISLGQTAFLFTGDAEALSEQQQLASGYDLSAAVLKVGHHGSSTSTAETYLQAVSPRYAVISCGAGNSYGHPHAETLELLAANNITVCRTDEAGTVVFSTDGTNIEVYSYGK